MSSILQQSINKAERQYSICLRGDTTCRLGIIHDGQSSLGFPSTIKRTHGIHWKAELQNKEK